MVVTFIVCEDLKQNFKTLCVKRLGKQRLEALQIIDKLEYFGKNGWTPSDYKGTDKARYVTQPVLAMWKGHTDALKLYYNACIDEWVLRGYKNYMQKFELSTSEIIMPSWFSWKPLHYSHQAALMRKAPDDYGGKFPDLPESYMKTGYVWPTRIDRKYFDYPVQDVNPVDVCGPLPNHRYCEAKFSSGPSKGKICHAKIKDRQFDTCRRHRKQEKE